MPAEVWVLVLARDPARAKSRLAGALGPRARAALALALLEDTLETARAARVGPVWVASDSRAVGAVARARGARTIWVSPRGTRSAARDALAAAARRGARHAIVLPADLPLLRPADLVALAARARRSPVVLAPDLRGEGTNALAVSPPDAFAPRFGPGSFDVHRAAAAASGLRVAVVRRSGLGFDLDLARDLDALRASRRRPGPRTAAVVAASAAPAGRAPARAR